MANSKSIPIVPLLPPPGAALPDLCAHLEEVVTRSRRSRELEPIPLASGDRALPSLDEFVKAATAKSRTLAEALSTLKESLAPYVDHPQAANYRFMYQLLVGMSAIVSHCESH